MNRHHDERPLSGRDSRIAVVKLYPSRQMATRRITIATIGDSSP